MTDDEAIILGDLLDIYCTTGFTGGEHLLAYCNELIEQYSGEAYDQGLRDGREGRC